ncbi:MAG: hypothetical protein EZS28_027391, partial [Streblomastix strix]
MFRVQPIINLNLDTQAGRQTDVEDEYEDKRKIRRIKRVSPFVALHRDIAPYTDLPIFGLGRIITSSPAITAKQSKENKKPTVSTPKIYIDQNLICAHRIFGMLRVLNLRGNFLSISCLFVLQYSPFLEHSLTDIEIQKGNRKYKKDEDDDDEQEQEDKEDIFANNTNSALRCVKICGNPIASECVQNPLLMKLIKSHIQDGWDADITNKMKNKNLNLNENNNNKEQQQNIDDYNNNEQYGSLDQNGNDDDNNNEQTNNQKQTPLDPNVLKVIKDSEFLKILPSFDQLACDILIYSFFPDSIQLPYPFLFDAANLCTNDFLYKATFMF